MRHLILLRTITLGLAVASGCGVEEEADVADDDVVTAPDAVPYEYFVMKYPGCVTFDTLRAASDRHCQQTYGKPSWAVQRDYALGCSNAPGHGARKVTFTCALRS